MHALGWVSCAIVAAAAGVARAEPATIHYDIAAQPLERALLQLGIASGRQILFAPEVVKGRTSRPVRGVYEFQSALGEMLPPGLEGVPRGALMIVRNAPQGPAYPTEERLDGARAKDIQPSWTSVEELVVTALKHETLLQRTPISITVLGRDLAVRGDTSLNSLYRSVPGLSLTSNGADLQRIAIRGVRSPGDATTGLYYDDTPVTGPAGSDADPGSSQPDLSLFDVERVEVLRGPQGTLYGAGSMGGTVRVIFRKPDMGTRSAWAEARTALTDHGAPSTSLRLAANLPLSSDRLALRVVAYGEEVGGYVDNVRFNRANINGERLSGGRALITYKPTASLDLTATAITQSSHAGDAVSYWYPRLGVYNTDANIVADYRSNFDLLSLAAKWDAPWGTAVAMASRYEWKTRYISDYTATLQRAAAEPVACQRYFSLSASCDGEQAMLFATYAQSRLPGAWSQSARLRSDIQEVRASSPPSGRLAWTLGLFRESRQDHFDSTVYKADRVSGRVLFDEDRTGDRSIQTSVVQTAGYGEASLRPAAGVTLTVGARRYRYERIVGGQVFIPNRITGSKLTPFREVGAEERGWVTKVSLAYEPAPRLLTYVTRAEGFRPGGANNVPGAGDEAPETYEPDSLVSYEAGLKVGFLGGALTVNAAAYVIAWNNMQVSATSPNGAWRFNTNAGEAEIRGGEVELLGGPWNGVSIVAGVGCTDAKLVDDQRNALGTGLGRAGDRLPFTPRWTASASISKRVQIADFATLFRADYSYTGSAASQFHSGLITYQRQPPYSLLDLDVAAERGGAEVSLRMTNVLNVSAPQMVLTNLSGIRDQTFSVRPRTLTLAYRRVF